MNVPTIAGPGPPRIGELSEANREGIVTIEVEKDWTPLEGEGCI